ncbi:hypothetical protein J2S06_001952 [Bacillus alveayuensis]|jgi:hypothetical protein|uniref:CcmD family protein n=1 Tax=Aeribacillus alveayuensis TaxID=279215 RepID=A0ABT9VPT8_9BACI|nr:hypothetical protein [Bacillus alveayuensis]
MVWAILIGAWVMGVIGYISLFQAAKRADDMSEEYWRKKK